MAQKILVSKPTKDVLTNLSLNDYYFHSDYPHLKVHAFGSFSIPSSNVQITIYHNLGYIPHAIVFSQFVNNDGSVTNEYYQQSWDILLGGEIFGYNYIYNDRIVIYVGSPATAARSVSGFYFIFKEQIL